jgi:hypothetical protein
LLKALFGSHLSGHSHSAAVAGFATIKQFWHSNLLSNSTLFKIRSFEHDVCLQIFTAHICGISIPVNLQRDTEGLQGATLHRFQSFAEQSV